MGPSTTRTGWQIALGIAAAVFMAPVAGLMLVFLIASALPVIPLLASLLVGFRGHVASRGA